MSQPHSNSNALDGERRFAGVALTDLVIALGLILSILAVYAQVSHFGFMHVDDDLYVYGNANVQDGLTPESLKWAFTSVDTSNWIPVTLLSHVLDVQLFGPDSAGMHHLVNVMFHALASVLLFMALQRATRARWPSAFVALVFALHPLHVESVAWISERKDVLSAFFLFLALYFYVRYTERSSPGRYLCVAGLFCLGLLSKPMLVTFPFTLLLFDFWPLRRTQWPKLVWEKVPLFAISAGASAVSYWVQKTTGGVTSGFPLAARIMKALISYVTYFRQTLWPTRLAAFYPYPPQIHAWQAAQALILLLLASALAISARRTRPYLAMGWLWYLGTLVPVIGLVQIGMQSHADRYTYIPMVGLLVMLAWGAADVVTKWPRSKLAIAAAATVSCAACMALTWTQAAYWQNSELLYQRTIDVTDDNWVAHGTLGYELGQIPGRRADAIDHLETALRIKPDYAGAHNNLGMYLMESSLYDAAISHFAAAVQAAPGLAAAHINLARALTKIPGRSLDAVAQYRIGLQLNPGRDDVHRELAELLVSVGRTDEAISHFEAAQRIHPDPETSSTIERLRK